MSSKNYQQQGGEKWVIGGELELAEGGRLLFNGQEISQLAGQADSTATTVAGLKEDFNALLGRLFAAGLMVVDKSALATAIAEAREVLNAAEIGILLGQYYESDYETFAAAIAAAQVVMDNAEATQNQVAAALAALETAVSTFEGAVITVNKTALIAAIADAQAILDDAVVGILLGQYYEDDYNTFESAIGDAQDVVDSKIATQDDIDTAVTALGTAVSTFEGAVITVDKAALIAAIADAQAILDAAVVGSDPGEYPEAAYNTFESAIETAQAVVDSKTATQSDINTAVTTLETAISTFEGAQIE